MNSAHPYTIYSASAGAGKTATLTMRYLSLILSDEQPLAFRSILGITFTNKAVGEMKHRILGALNDFANSTKKSEFIFDQVLEAINQSSDTKVDETLLRSRARKRLKELLHNYAYFDIATIDKFNHRLIKTFAKDLRLSSNFKVIIDSDDFLNEGIEVLFSRLSEDPILKEDLISFAAEKIENNNSWDVSYDLFNTSKLLFDETHFEALQQLSTKTDTDFKTLKLLLKRRIESIESGLKTVASSTIDLLESQQLMGSFKGNYFTKFLKKIKVGDWPASFDQQWLVNFQELAPYNKTTPEDEKQLIDQLKPDLDRVVEQLLSLFKEHSYKRNAFKNIQPLSLIFKVQQQLIRLMEEQERLPIAEFNKRIFEVVRKQAVPFIYERLGERYTHFFVDEFQDTSELQWENLIPLISNALSTSDGTAMIVGDPKQAIYRWRGGNASQLIGLYEQPSAPFPVIGKPMVLAKNYRSAKTIVEFNNSFFEKSAESIADTAVKNLFKNTSRQDVHHQEVGWVSIEFVEGSHAEDRSNAYCEKTLASIESIVNEGFAYADICVLTRSNKQSVILAAYLNEKSIPIISSESLLLSSSDEVCFLIDLLYTSFWPNENYYKAKLLEFLYKNELDSSQKIKIGLQSFEEQLHNDFDFSLDYFRSLEVYDALSYAIERFQLAQKSSAYITYFLDQVYEYFQNEHLGLMGFLEQWETHKEKWSVKSPQSVNAVQLMTIHKSKGLEFDFVILPFADQDIISTRPDDVLWVPVNPEEFAGFNQLLFSKNNSLSTYNEISQEAVIKEDGLKSMDSFNTLYVAMTRGVKGLKILSYWDVNNKGDFKKGTFSELFHSYISDHNLWDGTNIFQINSLQALSKKPTEVEEGEQMAYRYSYKSKALYQLLNHEKMLYKEASFQAKEAGTTWHRFLEFVHTHEDLSYAGVKLLEEYPFEDKEYYCTKGAELVSHPALKAYYCNGIKSVNEQTIFTKEGEELRPDRLVFFDRKVVIIDYKTGKESAGHEDQINAYARALEELNYQISQKLIVYIHQELTIKTVS